MIYNVFTYNDDDDAILYYMGIMPLYYTNTKNNNPVNRY